MLGPKNERNGYSAIKFQPAMGGVPTWRITVGYYHPVEYKAKLTNYDSVLIGSAAF